MLACAGAWGHVWGGQWDNQQICSTPWFEVANKVSPVCISFGAHVLYMQQLHAKFSLIYEEQLAMAIDAPDKVSHAMLISLAGATLHGPLCVLPHRVELASAQGAKK